MNIHKLVKSKPQSNGRNNQGIITVFHRGGGNAKMCRIIDFKRSLFDIPAIVIRFGYGYRWNSKIALVCYKNGMLSYILAPTGLVVGNVICAGLSTEPLTGNALPLCNIPTGTIIHNVELKPGRGGQIMRAAGTYAKILRSNPIQGEIIIRLCSGTIYSLSTRSMATIGTVARFSNTPFRL